MTSEPCAHHWIWDEPVGMAHRQVCSVCLRERALPETIDALRSSLADSRMICLHLARRLTQYPTLERDHACGQCVPDGPIIQAGFVCAMHVAKALMSAAE